MTYNSYPINGVMVDLGDPTAYIIQSLTLPKDGQDLPGRHYELKQGMICGPIGSGKSTSKDWLADKARKVWPPIWNKKRGRYEKQIEFFDAEDMGGTIESLRQSEAYFKFVVFEDAIRKGFESRRSGSNVSNTEKFFIIRHQVKKEGKNLGGVIFLLLLTQDFKRIDPSFREHAAIFIFKGYVRGCEEFIKNNKDILDELYELSDNATRVQRNDVRQKGFIINKRGKYFRFATIIEEMGKPIPWINTHAGTTLKKQFNIMRDLVFEDLRKHYLKQLKYGKYEIKLENLTEGILKGFLDIKLEEYKEKWTFCEIGRVNFTYIIRHAKRMFIEWKKKEYSTIIKALNNKNNLNPIVNPNSRLEHDQAVVNFLSIVKIATINKIHEVTKIPKNSLRNTLADKKELFENVSPGHGVYCLKGYNYTQEEIETIIGKRAPMKKLKMSG